MEKLFVPYELAVKLKERGFSEPCFSYFQPNIEARINQFFEPPNNPEINEEGSRIVCAPLYQQVIDWLEEKHKIQLSRIFYNDKITPTRWVYHLSNEKLDNHYVGSDYNKAIEEALKLIK